MMMINGKPYKDRFTEREVEILRDAWEEPGSVDLPECASEVDAMAYAYDLSARIKASTEAVLGAHLAAEKRAKGEAYDDAFARLCRAGIDWPARRLVFEAAVWLGEWRGRFAKPVKDALGAHGNWSPEKLMYYAECGHHPGGLW